MSPALQPQQDRSRATRRLLLDAALEEMLQHGYLGLATTTVARRAGVSRGAQQNHFPSKATLAAEALRHLAEREVQALHDVVEGMPQDPRERAGAALDFLFDQFTGPLFGLVTELAIVGRDDPELVAAVEAEERAMSATVVDIARRVFGEERGQDAAFAHRWTTALAAIRGVALLQLLRHSPETTRRLWTWTRGDLLELLLHEGRDHQRGRRDAGSIGEHGAQPRRPDGARGAAGGRPAGTGGAAR